jgi:hypothetical protein
MGLRTRHQFTVTAPTAGLTTVGVEKTATQGEGQTVVGLLVPLSPGTMMKDYGLDSNEPFQLFVATDKAALFAIGGQVTSVTMASGGASVNAGPLYVIADPQTFITGASTDHALILLDANPPR